MKKHGRNKKVLQPPVQQVPLTSMPFSNRQTLGKVRRRVLEALLKSPRKKTYIMTALSKDTCTVVQSAQIQHQNEIHQKVIDFYCDDRISCMTPGVKDYIIVRGGGQKHSVQERHLMCTLKENHAMFLEENPQAKVSFSKFCKSRPKHVILLQEIPENTCLCKKHENVRLLLQSLQNAGIQISTHYREFLSKIVCDQ